MAEKENREVPVTDLTRGEIKKEVREYCLNLILNTVLSDKAVLFDPQTSHHNLLSDSKKGTP